MWKHIWPAFRNAAEIDFSNYKEMETILGMQVFIPLYAEFNTLELVRNSSSLGNGNFNIQIQNIGNKIN